MYYCVTMQLRQCELHRPCVLCQLSSDKFSSSVRRRITRPDNCNDVCLADTESIAPVNYTSAYTINSKK